MARLLRRTHLHRIALAAVVAIAGAAAAPAVAGPSERAVKYTITATPSSVSVPWGSTVTVTGVLDDDDPTTGPLAGREVELTLLKFIDQNNQAYVPVVTTTTDETGAYSATYEPHESFGSSYFMVVSRYGEEDSTYTYDDYATSDEVIVSSRSVVGNVTITRASDGVFTAKGGIAPRARQRSRIELWAGRRGQSLVKRDEVDLTYDIGQFGRRFRLAPGVWNIQLRYVYRDGRFDTGVYGTAIVLR